jgi:hypothetical protein
MLPGFFAAELIIAKQMPIQLVKADEGDHRGSLSPSRIEKPIN